MECASPALVYLRSIDQQANFLVLNAVNDVEALLPHLMDRLDLKPLPTENCCGSDRSKKPEPCFIKSSGQGYCMSLSVSLTQNIISPSRGIIWPVAIFDLA